MVSVSSAWSIRSTSGSLDGWKGVFLVDLAASVVAVFFSMVRLGAVLLPAVSPSLVKRESKMRCAFHVVYCLVARWAAILTYMECRLCKIR